MSVAGMPDLTKPRGIDDFDSIFISIASFRDAEAPRTIVSALKQAKNPYRIYFGICQQNKDDDTDAVKNELVQANIDPDIIKNNIRIMRIPDTEAKGPTWARYLCSLLYRNEKYYMQIDSHIMFGLHWDSSCAEMIQRIKRDGLSQKPILSYYPKHYDGGKEVNDVDPHNGPRICKAFLNDRSMISYPGAEVMKIAKRPTLSAFVAAGTFFCEGYFVYEVPYDPELPNLFVGEEILFSARMWTSGWDIFNINGNVTYHYYTREKEPKFWDDNKRFDDAGAFAKVKYMMKMPDANYDIIPDELKGNMDRYGMGKTRSVEDFWKFAGIDLVNKKITRDFCRNDKGEVIDE